MEVLISEVQKRSALWNKSDYRYKDRRAAEREWDEVAKNVAIPKEDAKKKWRNLRDQFSKELKKIPKCVSGASQEQAPIYTGKWQHFKSLNFLRDSMTPRETEGNLSLVSENSTTVSDAADIEALNVEANNTELSSVEARPSKKTSPISRKRKKINKDDTSIEHRLLDIETKKLALLEASEDDNSLFLRSLLPSMKTLDPIGQLRVRMKFQEVLLQEMQAAQSRHIEVSSRTMSSTYSDLSAPESPIISVYQEVIPNSYEVSLEPSSQITFENVNSKFEDIFK